MASMAPWTCPSRPEARIRMSIRAEGTGSMLKGSGRRGRRGRHHVGARIEAGEHGGDAGARGVVGVYLRYSQVSTVSTKVQEG